MIEKTMRISTRNENGGSFDEAFPWDMQRAVRRQTVDTGVLAPFPQVY